jgi:hypothetical protein
MSTIDDDWPEATAWIKGEKAETETPFSRTKHLPTKKQAKLIDGFASEITTLWHKSREAIYALATACAEAAKQLDPGQKKILMKKLPFGDANFSKFVQIGKDQRIIRHLELFPPSMSTIYEITLLSDEQLKLGIETGIIDANATREDIKDFRDGGSRAPATGKRSESGRRSGATNKAQNVGKRGGHKTSKDEYLDDFLEDEESSDPVYDALVAEWKRKGLSRIKWQAAEEKLREKLRFARGGSKSACS